MIIAVLALMGVSFTEVRAENNIKAPEGYQGHLEQSNIFMKDGNTGTGFATTHGFYYTDNTFVGLGFGLNFLGDGEVVAPFYASCKYLFQPEAKVSPTFQMRMGSYFNNERAKPYIDAAIGLRFASNRDFAFSILVAGSYYNPYKSTDSYYDSVNNNYVERSVTYDPTSISIRMGIEW